MQRERGQSLVEVLVAGAIAAIMVTAVSATIGEGRRGTSLAAATGELRAIFHRTRMLAIARDANVGVKFVIRNDVWRYSVYEDGDGDGVRNDDIAAGRDRQLEPERMFLHLPAKIGVPDEPVRDPMNLKRLLGHRLPVRFNGSTICSFSRAGEATNGSIVLTDGRRANLLQVHGRSARISVWRWDGKRWRQGE